MGLQSTPAVPSISETEPGAVPADGDDECLYVQIQESFITMYVLHTSDQLF